MLVNFAFYYWTGSGNRLLSWIIKKYLLELVFGYGSDQLLIYLFIKYDTFYWDLHYDQEYPILLFSAPLLIKYSFVFHSTGSALLIFCLLIHLLSCFHPRRRKASSLSIWILNTTADQKRMWLFSYKYECLWFLSGNFWRVFLVIWWVFFFW